MDDAISPSGRTIGVVGASARAAVHSLLRSELQGWGIDLFNDRDLRAVAPCAICPSDAFPGVLAALSESFPPGPILYTGGLENHPPVVERLASKRPLLGNPPDVLNRVRDPYFVNSIQAQWIQHPRLIPRGVSVPDSGHWLRKPLHSSSGHGIRSARAHEPVSAGHYFQEHIDGTSMSALFISVGRESCATRLLGISEQLIGQRWLHARAFAYCGNVGPVLLPDGFEKAIGRFGMELARAAGLRGLWGVDFILKGDQAYPVEVNPRYTAAVEVLELAGRFMSLKLHFDCFTQPGLSFEQEILPGRHASTVGKAIYYAPHRIVFPPSGPWDNDLAHPFNRWRVPAFADIPDPGSTIEAGSPVLSLFTTGSNATDCLERLQSRARELDRIFEMSTA